MPHIHCSLPAECYTWRNALLWGNCSHHFHKKDGSWESRAVNVIIGLIESLPLIGQFVSIAEKLIIPRVKKHFSGLADTHAQSAIMTSKKPRRVKMKKPSVIQSCISPDVNPRMVQIACETFAEKQELTFYVNRARSLYQLPRTAEQLIANRALRAKCLRKTSAKIEKQCQYFFSNSKGDLFYINQETADQFTEVTKEKFPTLKISHLYALVDKKKDIELMPLDSMLAYPIESKSLEVKIRALVAKAIINID